MNIVKLISKASECNINQFMSCAFDNDLSVLVVSGNPSPKQLAAAWEEILTEFNDLSGQSEPADEIVLLRQIKMLEARITAIESFIFTDEESIKLIGRPFDDLSMYHKYGYQISFNGNKTDFLRQLNEIKQAEVTYRIDHRDLCEQLENLKVKESKINSTGSRKNFLEQINHIENFYKRQIDFEKYSVERLAVLINQFREMVQTQSKN
jgi:hypothetical protein